MENLTKTTRFILFICVLAFVLWSGSYISKYLLIYQFFEPEMDLKPVFQNVDFVPIFRTISSVFTLNIFAYPIYVVFVVLFVITSKLSIKNEGWLFVILIFTIITAPFELFSLYKDYIMLNLINSGRFDNLLILTKEKIIEQSSFPIVQFLFIAAVVFLAVFKPLRKKYNE